MISLVLNNRYTCDRRTQHGTPVSRTLVYRPLLLRSYFQAHPGVNTTLELGYCSAW